MDDDGRGHLMDRMDGQWVWVWLEPVAPPASIRTIHDYTFEVLHVEEDLQQED